MSFIVALNFALKMNDFYVLKLKFKNVDVIEKSGYIFKIISSLLKSNNNQGHLYGHATTSSLDII